MRQSRLIFKNKLPLELKFENTILIYDKVLEKNFSGWVKKFPKRVPVKSGEGLKDVHQFPLHIEKILKISEGISKDDLAILSFGGGSVGDFSGFVASILKRGVHLIHIPSTWLSSIDSAHGGKTALNASKSKNQIGTYYPAHEIYLVKEVLLSQPEARLQDVKGEYYKTALIAGGEVFKKACKNVELSSALLWKELPELIKVKQKIVKKDPYEQKGLRHVLNLGHTVGHVIENELGITHGQAVWYGTLFSILWGNRLGMKVHLPKHFMPNASILPALLKLIKNPKSKLMKDKKVTGSGSLRFIFVQKPGKTIVKKVFIKDLVNEWNRQAK